MNTKMKTFTIILIFFSAYNAKAQVLTSFGFDTGIADSSFYKSIPVYNLTDALHHPESTLAVTLGSKDSNLAEVKNLVHLEYLYFDETFFVSSVNLKKQKTEALFNVLSSLGSIKFVSIHDTNLLPYIRKIKSLKGLRCNTFDNTLFNSLKTDFSNLELLIINDPAAEVVNVSGLNYLKQLEIYSMYMATVDESVCELLTLKALRMKPGKLTALPKNFSRLKNLSYFSLTGTTFFKGFPYPVLSLTNLQTLELDLLAVKSIPPGLADFKSLRKLIFNEARKISELPVELKRLPVLTMIEIRDAGDLEDVSVLLEFEHPFSILLSRCNYLKIAKQLATSAMLKNMFVSKSIYYKDLEKLKLLIPQNKLLLSE